MAQDRSLLHAQPRCPCRAAGHEHHAIIMYATKPHLFGQRGQQTLAQLPVEFFQSRRPGEQAVEAAAVRDASRTACVA